MSNPLRQTYDLLSPVHRRALPPLLGWMLVAMLLETLGLGLVLPALTLLTQTGIDPSSTFARLGRELGISTREQAVVAGMLVLLAVYTVKFGFLAWTMARQYHFVFDVQADLSQRLFERYLRRPHTFHLQHNSAELVRNVVTATNDFTMTGLYSALLLATEGLVLAGVISLLLWVEPLGVLLAGALVAATGWWFNRHTRRRVRAAAEALQVHEGRRILALQQALGAAKELKLLGREAHPIESYRVDNLGSARIGRRRAIYVGLPKLWLELLAVAGLSVVVVAMVWRGRAPLELVPSLGLFAAAAFRMIPSANRVLASVQYVRYSFPVVRMLHQEFARPLQHPIEPAAHPLPAGTISLRGVCVRYPECAEDAIGGIDLDIQAGTTIGIIGGSGAGKSTLVDALLGLLPLREGSIRVGGADIAEHTQAWQRSIGYVPQTIFLIDDSIRRNIALGLPDAQIDAGRVQRAVRAAQLEGFVAGLQQGLDSVVGERGVRLSGGQRQRIGIARALYHDPGVLVLDEATSALDSDTERDLMQAIEALHGTRTIIIVTHRVATLRWCDRVCRISAGRLSESAAPAEGAPAPDAAP